MSNLLLYELQHMLVLDPKIFDLPFTGEIMQQNAPFRKNR